MCRNLVKRSAPHDQALTTGRMLRRPLRDQRAVIMALATSINAEIMQLNGDFRLIADSTEADVILLDGNTFDDLAISKISLPHALIIKAGEVKRCAGR